MVAVGDHLAHQRRVVGGDIVADELGHVREAHDPVVERDPLVHPAELDVADHVVDRLEDPLGGAGGPGRAWRSGHVSRQVGPVVAGPVDEGVPQVAVGRDRGDPHGAMLVGQVVRLFEHRRAGGARVRDALVDIGHLAGRCRRPVPVPAGARSTSGLSGRTAPLSTNRTAPTAQHVGDVVPQPGLRPGVGDQLHPVHRLEEQRRLCRVAHRPYQRVPAADRERVARDVVLDQPDQLPQLRLVQFRRALLIGKRLVDRHACLPCHART